MNRALLAAVTTVIATSAFGGTFATDTFEGTGSGWAYTYGYQVTPPYTKDLVASSGKDGTQAVKMVMDFSGVPMAPWGGTYFGAGLGSYMTVSAQPMTTIISEYSASFDAKVVGTWSATGHSNVDIELQFFSFDDTNPDGTPATPDADDQSEFFASFKSTVAVARLAENVWETRSVTWDQFTGADIDGDGPGTALYTWDIVQSALAAGNLHGMNLALPIDDGANADGRYGIDAGNELWVDNYAVSVVPEPSVLASLGLASLGLIRRRRH